MKKAIYILAGTTLLSIFIWTFFSLYQQSQAKSQVFQTGTPVITDIVKKTIATGSIVPRREIFIKSRISGVVEKIFVAPGQYIKKGEVIALVRIIPNMVALNAAQSALNLLMIQKENAKTEFERNEKLYKDGLISEAEFNQFFYTYKKLTEEVGAAESNVELVKSGTSTRIKSGNNRVVSTVSGMVLDVQAREGGSVIESNTFNDGSTIATVADMNELFFVGKIEESEVDKVKEGMDLILTLGAIEWRQFPAKLTYISPKGVDVEGAVQFEIKGAVQIPEDQFIRAGYSATADVVLARAEKVMAIPENQLLYYEDKVYVEVETKPQVFEPREVATGISDGMMVEIKSGLSLKDRLKFPQ